MSGEDLVWERFPAQNPDTPARTIDGAAIVITPRDSRLHTLNETATFIWDRADGKRSLREITDELVREFDVDEAAARRDALAFVNDAVGRGLLVVHDQRQ